CLLSAAAFGQWFGTSNASRIQGQRVKNPLACSDTYSLVWVAANLQFECLAGGSGVGGAANLTTVGAIPYVSATGVLNQDQTAAHQFFWDATNHRLGIGTVAPTSPITIQYGATANDLIEVGLTGSIALR